MMRQDADQTTVQRETGNEAGKVAGMDGSERSWRIFSLYTIVSVLFLMAMVPLFLLMFLELRLVQLWREDTAATLALAAVTATAVLSAAVALRRWDAAPSTQQRGNADLPRLGTLAPDRWMLPLALATVALLLVHLVTAPDPRILVTGLATAAGAVLIRLPVGVGVLGASVVAGIALALGLPVPEAASVWGVVIGIVLAARLSLWLAELVRELEQARTAQARLAVAEERLRFARDLHDTTGRDLSAIAVTAELVAQLAERGDARTPEQAREVAQIARTSLATTRSLVRGYREADLPTELQGTASLLRAADVRVEVIGGAEDVDPAHAEPLAWALREGGTNILRHARATTARIELRRDRLRLVNDGADPDAEIREGNGLRGMRERLGEGAEVRVHQDRGVVTLDVSLPPAGSSLEQVGPRPSRSTP